MKTEKAPFDEIIRRLLNKPPQKTADIHTKKTKAKKVPSLTKSR